MKVVSERNTERRAFSFVGIRNPPSHMFQSAADRNIPFFYPIKCVRTAVCELIRPVLGKAAEGTYQLLRKRVFYSVAQRIYLCVCLHTYISIHINSHTSLIRSLLNWFLAWLFAYFLQDSSRWFRTCHLSAGLEGSLVTTMFGCSHWKYSLYIHLQVRQFCTMNDCSFKLRKTQILKSGLTLCYGYNTLHWSAASLGKVRMLIWYGVSLLMFAAKAWWIWAEFTSHY
jgi:hypothetical protein